MTSAHDHRPGPMTGRAGALGPWLARLRHLDDVRPPVVVACSGGPDSLALLALAAARGLAPVAVHVDHGLRAGSERDVGVVAAACRALGAPHRLVRVEIEPGPNLEARARIARHTALERARADVGASCVLLGHTADDQAETVLLNLLRGSAGAGLGGMPGHRDGMARPLLGLRRADTLEICARLAFAPVRDPMNDDPSFRRVWLRREVIPMLERAAGRDLVEVLARQADVLRSESGFLDRLAAGAWPGAGSSSARALAALDPVLARRAVRRWTGSPPPSLREVDGVLAVARGERRAVDLAGGRRVSRHGGVLRLGRARLGNGAVAVRLPGVAEGHGITLESWVERDAPVRWPDGRWTCVVDGDVVGASAVLHRSGRGRRSAVVLGRDGTGEPIWEVGYRVAAPTGVTPRTRRFLWMTAHQAPGS